MSDVPSEPSLQSSQAANKQSLLRCGRHSDVQRSHQIRSGRVKKGSCICDYEDFQHLLEERIAAQSKNLIPKPFRLLSFPLELREMIYSHLLVAPEPIEVCPEPFSFSGYAPAGERGRKNFDKAWAPLLTHHSGNNRRSAQIFRVNRTLFTEASRVFFAKNEFRFSSVNGWVALDWFMYYCRLEGCRTLRSLTIHDRTDFIMPLSGQGEEHFTKGVMNLTRPLPRESPGLFYPVRWFEQPLSNDPTHVLRKMNDLRHLRIVIGWRGKYDAHGQQRLLVEGDLITANLNTRNMSTLQITLVSLRAEEDDWAIGSSNAAAIVESHNRRVKAGGGRGERLWLWEEKVFDKWGRY